MYPPTQLVRACVGVLLCGVRLCSWAQAGKAQGVTKAGTIRKGVGTGSTLAPQSTFTFSNSTPITISDTSAATPYPSNITVSGFASRISTVRVRLNGVSHTFPSDIDILLVSPGGQKFILMSDASASTPISNATLTFDDAAAAFLPANSVPVTTGSYKPTNFGGGNQ